MTRVALVTAGGSGMGAAANAGSVAFLLSDAAGYITGACLRVDGGVARPV